MSLPFTADLTMRPHVQGFFDEATNALSYVVRDPASSACAIIDPVLDIDYAAGHISHESADHIISYVKEHGLTVEWLIETHVHADHISAAHYIKGKLGGRIGIGHNVTKVQAIFGEIFNETDGFSRDGSQFDHLFQDGEGYRIGGLTGHAMDTPGHTPACMTHVIGDAAFVADTIFMPSSLDMVSFFIMPSLDIVSFFIMPSSLPILSWAKAAGDSARPSERAAAETPSAMRVRMVMDHLPFEVMFVSDIRRYSISTDGPRALLRRRR